MADNQELGMSTDQVYFYVVPEKVDAFLDATSGFTVHYDEERRRFRANRGALDFNDAGLKQAIAYYGEKSGGHFAWMAREYTQANQPSIVKVAEAVAAEVASPNSSISVSKLAEPMAALPPVEKVTEEKVGVGAYAAVRALAIAEGRHFQAQFILHGFELISDRPSKRRPNESDTDYKKREDKRGANRQSQLKLLKAASPRELLSIKDRNFEVYWPLSNLEDKIRVRHAITHDPVWEMKYKALEKDVGAQAAEKEMITLFQSLLFDEKKRLASIGEDGPESKRKNGPVGLDRIEDIGRMVAINNGSKAIVDAYYDKTGVSLGGGHLSRSSATISGVKTNTTLGSGVRKDVPVERGRRSPEAGMGF